MMAETTSPAASVDGTRRAASRPAAAAARRRTTTSVAIAERPLRADERADQVEGAVPVEPDDVSPSARTTWSSSTWFDVKPYFRQWAPPEFSATLPPIVHTCWLDGSGA